MDLGLTSDLLQHSFSKKDNPGWRTYTLNIRKTFGVEAKAQVCKAREHSKIVWFTDSSSIYLGHVLGFPSHLNNQMPSVILGVPFLRSVNFPANICNFVILGSFTITSGSLKRRFLAIQYPNFTIYSPLFVQSGLYLSLDWFIAKLRIKGISSCGMSTCQTIYC